MVPIWPQLLGLACLIAGIQIQVRAVEEPYLTRTHGTTYTAYTHRAGRFLPRTGRRHPHATTTQVN
jgi:protein-S-isoprenylcysteine O-methyltransferase Ste14